MKIIFCLTHWGRVTHICVGNLTTIGPDNGLSPGRRQAIIWTNAGILLIGPCGTNFGEIIIGIQTFSFKKMHLKMPSGKWRPFCLGLNVLTVHWNLFPRLQESIFHHWCRKCLGTEQATSHIWRINDALVYWSIYMSFSLDEQAALWY